LLDGGTLQAGAGIAVHGGRIGGMGTLQGGVTVDGSGTVQVGASPDALNVHGNYIQTGGSIRFEIDFDGHGGFLNSTLVIDPGVDFEIADSEIDFTFMDGIDPTPFLRQGLLDFGSLFFDNFFKLSDGTLFSDLYDWRDVFVNDTLAYSPLVATPAPEPGTLPIALAGLGIFVFVSRRRARRPISAAGT
jgi:hypothetical protein